MAEELPQEALDAEAVEDGVEEFSAPSDPDVIDGTVANEGQDAQPQEGSATDG